MNDRTKPLEDIIDIMEYRGEEYMFTGRSPLTYASSGALSAMRWVI